MIFDRLCGSDRFSTHEKCSIISESSEIQSKIINPPLREIYLFPHSFAMNRKTSLLHLVIDCKSKKRISHGISQK